MNRALLSFVSFIFGILLGNFSLLYIIILITIKIFPPFLSISLTMFLSGIYFELTKLLIEYFYELSFKIQSYLIMYYITSTAIIIRYSYANLSRLFASEQFVNICFVKVKSNERTRYKTYSL